MSDYAELIKWLRDCAKINILSLYKRGLMKQAADAIEELSILAENGETTYDIMVRQTSYIEELQKKMPMWIPVTERLPREQETVLTWGKQGVILFDWWHDNKWCCFGDVTHWMPLPKPPKEKT